MNPMMQVWTAAAIVLAGISMPAPAQALPSPYLPLAFTGGALLEGHVPRRQGNR
jgi:hypothetical protein